MKTLQVQVYNQQWFNEEQGTKLFLAKILIFLVWSEMSLGMHLSAGR